MVKAIQKSLNWRSRKVRAAAVLALAGAGLAAGFFGAAVRRAIAGEPVVKYCLYSVAVPPPRCTAYHLCGGVYIFAEPTSGSTCAGAMIICGQPADEFGTGPYPGTCPY